MIKATDLIAIFRKAREERWGYIWGKSGQIWTQAMGRGGHTQRNGIRTYEE